jgi:hypothetical protein
MAWDTFMASFSVSQFPLLFPAQLLFPLLFPASRVNAEKLSPFASLVFAYQFPKDFSHIRKSWAWGFWHLISLGTAQAGQKPRFLQNSEPDWFWINR